MTITAWQTLALSLHLAALALWLGSTVFFLVVFGPAANHLEPRYAAGVLNNGRKKFEAVAWTAIALLLLTGIVNLILRVNAARVGQFYWIALSIKLLMFCAMAFHHGLQVFKYGPEIERLAGSDVSTAVLAAPFQTVWQKWFTLLKINLTLGAIATLMGLVLMKS
jgi:uncharacterized membrane protein